MDDAADLKITVMKECSICLDLLDETSFVKLGCGHEFCNCCLTSQFRVCFATKKLDLIPCPEKNCQVRISKKTLKKFLPEGEFIRFHHLMQKKQNNLSDCPKCGKLLQREALDNPILQCVCGHKFCFFHSDAHPLSTSCDEFEKQLTEREDMILSQKTIQEIKSCPGCNNPVEKQGGCDHIKCVWCGTKFCYNCGGTTWSGSKEAPTCAGCGQGFLDHDYFWKWQLLSVLLAPIWIPIALVYYFCSSLCCIFCGWPCRLSKTPGRETSSCCELLRVITVFQCVPVLTCCVFWGCGPWHDLDEPPNEIEEVVNVLMRG